MRTQKERFRVHCEWNQTGEISCSDKGFSSRRDIPGTRTCWLEDPRSLSKERHEGFLEQRQPVTLGGRMSTSQLSIGCWQAAQPLRSSEGWSSPAYPSTRKSSPSMHSWILRADDPCLAATTGQHIAQVQPQIFPKPLPSPQSQLWSRPPPLLPKGSFQNTNLTYVSPHPYPEPPVSCLVPPIHSSSSLTPDP